jgi:hypothetical protein
MSGVSKPPMPVRRRCFAGPKLPRPEMSCARLQRHFEPVECEFYSCPPQFHRGRLVVDRMRHVCQQCSRAAQLPCDLQRLRDAHVRRMRLRAQPIQHDEVRFRSQSHCLPRDSFAVGIIGEAPPAAPLGENQAERVHASVRQQGGGNRSLRQLEHRGHRLQLERGVSPHDRSLQDRVRIHREDSPQPLLRRPDRQRLPAEQVTKAAQIIHSCDVVGMPVRQDEQIDPPNLPPDALQAKFRGRIDLDVQPIHDDVHARPRARVLRVLRLADRTVAGNHRHALGRARPQKCHFHAGI